MPITFRHDAAAVVPPSNQTTRKYGQSLVLQQNQQKYAAQQAGYDRMFALGRDAMQSRDAAIRQGQQNAFNTIRDVNQNVNLQSRQEAQNKFQLDQQRAQDFDAARSRIDIYAKDMLANGQITDPETRNKLQNLIAGKTIVMGSGFNETAQKEYLDKYNAELAKIMSEVPPPPAKPTRDEELKKFLGEGYGQYGHLPWTPDGKGGFAVSKEAIAAQQKEQELQQQQAEQMRPQSATDYYNHKDNKGQYEMDLDATMSRLKDERATRMSNDKELKLPEVTEDDAWKEMQKRYDSKQQRLGRPQYGEPTAGGGETTHIKTPDGKVIRVPIPEAQPAVPGAKRSILEQSPVAPPDAEAAAQPPAAPYGKRLIEARDKYYKDPTNNDAFEEYKSLLGNPTPAPQDLTIQPPDPGMPPSPDLSAWAEGNAAPSAVQGTGMSDAMLRHTNPDGSPKGPAKPTGQKDANGFVIMDDGSKVDPRDAYAMGGTGSSDAMLRFTNPNGTQKGPAKSTGRKDARGNLIMDDGSTVDPRDKYAMDGRGRSDAMLRFTNPDGSQKEPPRPTGKRDSRGYVIMDDGSTVDPRDAYALRGTPADAPLPEYQAAQEQLANNSAVQKPAVVPTPANAQPQQAQTPNFTDLIYKTKDTDEHRVLTALQGMYAGQPPEVQSAIGIILNDQSSLPDLKAANDYLRSAGIDIDQLAKYQHSGGGRRGKNK